MEAGHVEAAEAVQSRLAISRTPMSRPPMSEAPEDVQSRPPRPLNRGHVGHSIEAVRIKDVALYFIRKKMLRQNIR